MAAPTINIMDPSAVGWDSAGQGALQGITQVAPFTALAGAGLGALAAKKDHRLRGALQGAGMGALAGIAGNSAFRGYDAYNAVSEARNQLVQSMQEGLATDPAIAGSTKTPYLRDLWRNKAMAVEGFKDKLSPDDQRKFYSEMPTAPKVPGTGWLPWGLGDAMHLTGSTSTAAEGRMTQLRRTLLEDSTLHNSQVPLADYRSSNIDYDKVNRQVYEAARAPLQGEFASPSVGRRLLEIYAGQR